MVFEWETVKTEFHISLNCIIAGLEVALYLKLKNKVFI